MDVVAHRAPDAVGAVAAHARSAPPTRSAPSASRSSRARSVISTSAPARTTTSGRFRRRPSRSSPTSCARSTRACPSGRSRTPKHRRPDARITGCLGSSAAERAELGSARRRGGAAAPRNAIAAARRATFGHVLGVLTRNEFRARYRSQALGILWSLLNPLVQTAILTVIFSHVAAFKSAVPNLSGVPAHGRRGVAVVRHGDQHGHAVVHRAGRHRQAHGVRAADRAVGDGAVSTASTSRWSRCSCSAW